jgi:hypothetical protein
MIQENPLFTAHLKQIRTAAGTRSSENADLFNWTMKLSTASYPLRRVSRISSWPFQ